MAYLDNIHYQITGNPQGHKLVFLHGLMGSANNWMRVIPAFQDELGKRKIPINYDIADLEEDMKTIQKLHGV